MSKIGDCDLCRLELPVKTYRTGPPNNESTMDLCELCAGSLASNVVAYPSAHPGAFMVCHTILYVGNRILKELRALREDLARKTD